MKIFANNNIFKKIILSFVLLLSFSFVAPEPVQASVGGEIMNPICDLLVGLGDGIMNIMHKAILKQDITLLRVSEGKWNIVQIIIVAAAIIVIGVAIIATGGALAGAGLVAGAKLVVGCLTVVSITGVSAGIMFHAADSFSEEIPLPFFSLTPENILSGKIPLFDVNFINPSEEPMPYSNSSVSLNKIGGAVVNGRGTEHDNLLKSNVGIDYKTFINGAKVTTEQRLLITVTVYTKEYNGNTYVLKVYSTLSVPGVTTINQKIYELYTQSTTVISGEIKPYSFELQAIISKWYVILRTIAVVAMMSVLVYIGIRIVISSAKSTDKAKYKQMLGDWLIGMILLFTMHFIMNFSNMAVNSLTRLLTQNNMIEDVIYIPDKVGKKEGLAKKLLDEKQVPQSDNGKDLWRYYQKGDQQIKNKGMDDSVAYVEWHTNLMGNVRILANIDNQSKSDSYIGYTLVYLVLVIYTLIFSWTYIRRVVYMAFLTLIAPLVALTYPIDKVNDGSAQGFNYWFKEYIFNLLLQPLHLLIYTILVSSALEFTHSNWIYTLVALGFIMTAEKILRTMFNFQKASTPGAFAGPAGAALAMTGMRWLMGHGPRGRGNPGRPGNENGGPSDNNNDAGYSTGGSPLKLTDVLTGNNNPSGNNPPGNNPPGNNPPGNNPPGNNPPGNNPPGNNPNNNNRRIRMPRFLRPVANGARHFGRGLADTASFYGRGLTGKMSRNIQNARPIRSLARLGAGAASGAALGMVGLAAGIASGDVSKALQYTGAGLAGGYKLGSGAADSALDALSVPGTGEEFTRNMRGEAEHQRIQAERNKRNYRRDEKNIDALRKKNNWSRRQAEDFLNGTGTSEIYGNLVDLCLENNITDINDINNLRKAFDGGGWTNEQLVATFNTNNALFGGSTNTKEDDFTKMKETLEKTHYKGMSDPAGLAQQTIDKIKQLQQALNKSKL